MLLMLAIVAIVVTFGLMGSAVAMSLFEGQRRNRRRLNQLQRELDRLKAEAMTSDERRAEHHRRRQTEYSNERARSTYEYGGC